MNCPDLNPNCPAADERLWAVIDAARALKDLAERPRGPLFDAYRETALDTLIDAVRALDRPAHDCDRFPDGYCPGCRDGHDQ